MSEHDVKVSLEQISSVLRFVKLAAGIAFSCIVSIVGLAVWIKMTDQQLQANTNAIYEMKAESKEMQKISIRTVTIIEQQQKQLDKIQFIIDNKLNK